MRSQAESSQVRRALYVLFARLFASAPDQELYGRLCEEGLTRLAEAQGVDLMSDLLDSEDATASAAELQSEYVDLTRDVSLRASDYPGATDDPVAAVSGFLAEHGLSIDAGAGLPPDHLSIVLGIMGELAGADTAADDDPGLDADSAIDGEVAEARQRARLFYRRHLLPWAPQALAEVARHAHRRFYRGLASMVVAFLETERQRYGAA